MERPIFQGVTSSRALVWVSIAALLIAILIEKGACGTIITIDRKTGAGIRL